MISAFKRFIFYSLAGMITTAFIHIPILGLILYIIAFPVLDVFPYFGKSGEHIEIGFLWVIVKSQKAWLIFSIYYSVLWFILFTVKDIFTQKK